MLELCGITKRYTGMRFPVGRRAAFFHGKTAFNETAVPNGEEPSQEKSSVIPEKMNSRNKLVLDHVSLTLEPGIYGLLGPNGAGKSTLMNIITGNLKPTEGEVRWEGKDIRSLGAYYRSLLGYAPQQQGMYDHFSGLRFLSYMAALKGIPKKVQPGEIRRVLAFVNLWEERKRAVGTYSGGMKQRILIAQALLGDPKCIVLDEPTAGLDPRERVRIREQIRAISGDRIVLVSTHVVSDIEPIAAEILLLKAGKLVDRGTVDALCGKYGRAKGLEEVYMRIFGEDERHDTPDGL